MALSQADFYAFSKATGSPYVEDPEAQAQIAPQVAEWRRNQLKSPETKQAESSSLLNALGIGAAIAGGGALLAAGLGRRGGVRMGNARQAARQATQQVNVEDFGNVYRAAGRPAPSKPAPTPTPTAAATPRPAGSRQGGIKFADLSQIAGTEPKGLLRGRQPGADITPAAPRGALTSLEITEVPVVDITEAAQQPRLGGAKDFIAGYFQKTGTPAGYLTGARRQIPADSQIVAVQAEKPASLVDRQNVIESLVLDQTFNALGSAEDQMTGRVKQQLQRNEDLDMSQIDLMEEMAEYSRLQGMEQDEPGIRRLPSQAELMNMVPEDRAVAQGFNPTTVNKLKALDNDLDLSLQVSPQELGGKGIRFLHIGGREHDLNSPFIQAALKKHNITNEELNQHVQVSTENLKTRLQEWETKTQSPAPDAPINQVVAQLPDGPPVDQAEGTRRMSSQELADIAKSEMIARRQELVERGLRPGTMRFERALAQEWSAKPGLVPGSEEFNRQISMPTPIRKAVEVVEELGEEEGLPPKFLRSVPNVGPLAEVTKTAAGTAIRGASPSYHEALPKVATRQLYGEPDILVRGAPDELVPDLPAGLRLRGGIEPQIEEGDPGLSKQEIKFAVLDRPAEEQAPGGSAGIGVYGLEPGYVPGAVSKATGEYSAASSRKPTEVPAWIEKQQRGQFSGVSDQGLLRAMEKSGRTGQIAIQNELDRRQRARESVVASEVLRRARIEGRNPQEFLQTFEIKQDQPVMQQSENPGYARYSPQGYEVSSRGDKRYSAMYATLPTGQTIEQAYQSAKGTGKGQPAKDPNFDYWGTYKGLWNQYFDANPEALTEIARASEGKVLTDQFANTSNNQARAIHEILVERGLRQPFIKETGPSTAASVYDLPMTFEYRGQAIPDTPATTFEAIQAGLRTSTLRKPGQVPSRVQPGARITAVGPQGQRQLLEVTGRRMVTPEMAEELSQVERWTPDFLRNYIGRVGGGKLEQITYRMI